jgi:hypothetical protein
MFVLYSPAEVRTIAPAGVELSDTLASKVVIEQGRKEIKLRYKTKQ